MANDQKFDSRYTGEEMENAFSVALAIANHSGIPKGTGKGNIQIISLDTDRLTGDGERIPTSAAVVQAIAASRKVSELLTFKGIVQTADDLPADAKPGSVYIVVQEDNENYAWDGAIWTPIGKLIAPIVLSGQSVSYQISDSGDSVPTGEWVTDCPAVQQGQYLWTRTVVQFSVGDPITSYSCAYSGADGREITVSGVSPDETGNVTLTAADVGALAVSGGNMAGAINMNGQPISGLNDPTEDTQAARKGYVDAAATSANAYTDIAKTEAQSYTDTAITAAKAYTDASVRKAAPKNLLDNSDFTNLVAQAGIGGNHGTTAYAADRWILDSGTVSYEAGVGLTLNGTIRQKLEFPPTGDTSTFVGMASGEASISYADGAVTITSSGGVLKWAALYAGVYTDATMPDYQPKGYGAELAECRRYYSKLESAGIIRGASSNDTTIYAIMETPETLRTTPSIENTPSVLAVRGGGKSLTSGFGTVTFSIGSLLETGVRFTIKFSNRVITPGHLYEVVVDDLSISSDL